MEGKGHLQDLSARDAKYVWHSMRPYQPESTMVVEEADGVWITDSNGKRYLDAMAGLWCVNVGYGRKELAQAAYDQLVKMPYYPLSHSHQPAIDLGEKLNEWLGDDYIIYFSNSGSEANETAFKIARQYHRQNGESDRWKFISRYRAYHGNTMGALAATGQSQRKVKYEPLAPGFIHVAPPDCYRSPHNNENGACCHESARAIDQVMTWEVDETIAGVIMEPIISGGGVFVPHDNYLKEVRKICDEHGALLIIDEVINGFGRTGKPFAFMHYDIKPDIITMAKGMTSAYMPLSATAVRRELFEVFKGTEEYQHFRHVNTFGGSPAACAVALKNIEILEKENLIERADVLGKRLKDELEELTHHPYIGDIRSKGLLLGIELVADKLTKTPASSNLVNKVIRDCRSKGLLIGKNGDTVAGYNNILTLSPPLSISNDDFDYMVSILKESLKNLIRQ